MICLRKLSTVIANNKGLVLQNQPYRAFQGNGLCTTPLQKYQFLLNRILQVPVEPILYRLQYIGNKYQKFCLMIINQHVLRRFVLFD